MKLLAVGALLAALSGCAVGPDFKPPVNPPGELVGASSTTLAPFAKQSPDGRANADGALVAYEKTVLNALEETENAFVGYREQQARLKSLMEQAAASRRAAELAAIQYREGVSDFLTLLDAQRTQLSAESAVAESEGAVNASVVAIYKALGGVGEPSAAL